MEQQIFNDRYRVVAKIGAGGMADVYKAIDTVLDRPVAVKVLHRHFAEDEDFVSRFKREARAAASLNHPNIVSIYDWGSQNGTYFIIMELLEGQSLKQHIRGKRTVPPSEALEITKKVLSALSFAHKHDIVHRDVKPHNIILTGEGEVKVTDFGIARAGASTMTQTGTILGTAHYLSPEQARGQEVGITSDVYSMGVVLYEMVTGRVPFDGENPVAIALKHVHEAPIRPAELNPEVPSALQTIILKAMAKNPESRYQNAAEMRNDVMRLMEGMPIVAVPPEEQETTIMAPSKTSRIERPLHNEASAPKKRNWATIALVILLLIGAGAAGGWFMYSAGIINYKKAVTVPDVKNKSLDEAKNILESKNLKIGKVERTYSSSVEDGIVIKQDPVQGRSLDEGSEVSIVVSMGRKLVPIPDVIGDRSAVAATKIVRGDLEPGKYNYEPSDDFKQDQVIRTEPSADEGDVPVGTKIDLFISEGPAVSPVPDVEGKASGDAKDILKQAGFQVATVEDFSEDVTKGNVIKTIPFAGTEAKKGSTVTIYVSKGPKLIPVPNVLDMFEDQAQDTLINAGFVNINLQEIGGVGPNQDSKVISQEPSKDKQVTKNTRILIIVGRAGE